jgi:4-coumarate--CoA ligase
MLMPGVVRGYLNKPYATQESIEGGFYKTGDIAIRDDEGFFYVVDRKKELIKYKGYQGQSNSFPPQVTKA